MCYKSVEVWWTLDPEVYGSNPQGTGTWRELVEMTLCPVEWQTILKFISPLSSRRDLDICVQLLRNNRRYIHNFDSLSLEW